MAHALSTLDQTFTSSCWDTLYRKYLETILKEGEIFVGRNGETRSVFGFSIRADLRVGFPLTSLRKLPFKNLVREFLFDVGLSQNVEALGPAKHFWSFLADENGELGASAYNRQWRSWPASRPGSEVPNETLVSIGVIDQLHRVMCLLRDTPNSRHGTVITHNPTALNVGCPPCHPMMQFMPSNGFLDLMVPARSNDAGIGFPLDVARYAIILSVMAKMVKMTPRYLFIPSSNTHIYSNCYNQVDELINRKSKNDPKLIISSREFSSWDDLQLEDFNIEGYDPHPALKMNLN